MKTTNRFPMVVRPMLCCSLFLAACSQGTQSPAEETGSISAEEALQAGYQRTPFGLVHPDCIHEVNGEAAQTHAVCTHPSVARRSDLRAPANRELPQTDGWVEASWANMSTNATYMHAQFTVPADPSAQNSQLLYLFPSLEPSGGNAIIQPVLQWGVGAAGGGAYWAIASWYVDSAGNAQHSALKQVSSGDLLDGLMQSSSCTSSGACTWKITTKDVNTGVSTVLATKAGNFAYNQAQGGVLEVYGVNGCNEYPSDGAITFSSISVRDKSGTVSPDYQPKTWSADPSCGFSVDVPSTSSQTLNY